MLTLLAPSAFFLGIRFPIFFPASSSILSDTAKDFHIASATLATLERYEQAFHAFERATQFAPNDVSVHIYKGNALLYLRKCKEALAVYEKAIEITPNDASVYKCKGNAHSHLGRLTEAQQLYEKAKRLERVKGLSS